MYFLYGGCHSHPPALLCSKCRRQYCSPANAWGMGRPPVRRSKKPQKPKTPTRTSAKYHNNNVTKSSGNLQQQKVAGSSSPRSTSPTTTGSKMLVTQKQNSHTTAVIKKEPVKCGKSFAEKLRSLLSCIA